MADLEFQADDWITTEGRQGNIMAEVYFRKIDLVVLQAGEKLEEDHHTVTLRMLTDYLVVV